MAQGGQQVFIEDPRIRHVGGKFAGRAGVGVEPLLEVVAHRVGLGPVGKIFDAVALSALPIAKFPCVGLAFEAAPGFGAPGARVILKFEADAPGGGPTFFVFKQAVGHGLFIFCLSILDH